MLEGNTRSFEIILNYCCAPLQNLPWAERALVMVRSDEYAALLLSRHGNRLESYSTHGAENERRNAGGRYSIRILENLLTKSSNSLPEALAQFGRHHYLELGERDFGPAIQVPSLEAIGLAVHWIRDAARDKRVAGKADDCVSLQNRLAAHFVHLLDEHMGLETGVVWHASQRATAGREVGFVCPPEILKLKPLRGKSHYRRGCQEYLNLQASN